MWRKSSHCGASNTCVETQEWRKSRHCGANTGCVETAIQAEPFVEIRDSKFPDMPHIFLSKGSFGNLLNQIKNS